MRGSRDINNVAPASISDRGAPRVSFYLDGLACAPTVLESVTWSKTCGNLSRAFLGATVKERQMRTRHHVLSAYFHRLLHADGPVARKGSHSPRAPIVCPRGEKRIGNIFVRVTRREPRV